MATRGKAAVSASGAAMSKYDVEVEARLQKIEATLEELKSHTHSDEKNVGDVESRLDDLIARLNKKMRF